MFFDNFSFEKCPWNFYTDLFSQILTSVVHWSKGTFFGSLLSMPCVGLEVVLISIMLHVNGCALYFVLPYLSELSKFVLYGHCVLNVRAEIIIIFCIKHSLTLQHLKLVIGKYISFMKWLQFKICSMLVNFKPEQQESYKKNRIEFLGCLVN